MITVAGHISIRLVFDFFRERMRHVVPYGLSFAILVPSAFNLIGARTHTPLEAFGKSAVAASDDTLSVDREKQQQGNHVI